MDFFIFNSLNKRKEKLIPIKENEINLYACGPTVYNFAHIGNLRTYIFENILVKSLRYIGYKVTHCMNITDVGHLVSDGDSGIDKMSLGADRERKSIEEIATFYEVAFFKDCSRLNISRPSIVCKATKHIKEIIEMIKILERKGYTYVSNGNVYYNVSKFDNYANLADLSLENLNLISRIDQDVNKKNQLDFVLWFTNSKFKNHIMQWDSPWGVGFPGWHIECSAMALKYLGDLIDIHCGGIDHISVHHTNEIAQSEGALGHKCVNYWVHGEFLVVDGAKMSKSSEEFLTLSKLSESGFSPMDYRYFCLQSRYRKELSFSYENLNSSKKSLMKLKNRIAKVLKNSDSTTLVNNNNITNYKENFTKHICNDLNIPNAITVLYDVIKDNNLTSNEKILLIQDFDRVLSLDLLDNKNTSDINVDSNYINKLISERNEARNKKDWKKADEIRSMLGDLGIELLDLGNETKWNKI